MENTPESMPNTPLAQEAKFSGEIRSRWEWTEPSVWTLAMLATLEHNRVRAGKWHSLIDKVYKPANLSAAFKKVSANRGAAGVDWVSIEGFKKRLGRNLDTLHRQLRDDDYQAQSIRRVWIDKPGSREKRPLGIPTVRDRVVQTALRHVLEPILERQFAQHSYGFRPNRGCKDALRRVDSLVKQGYGYTVDVDLKSYFDTISHEILIEKLRQFVADGRCIGLVEKFLQADVMDGLEQWNPAAGAPQGAVISPLLSNLYLNDLDHFMEQSGYQMTRYADDMVIQCRSREQAHKALELVRRWCDEHALTLHPQKTCIVHVDDEGFDFLGYRFIKHRRFVRRKSLKSFRERIRRFTRRSNGHSLQSIIEHINSVLRGWFGYFKHCWRTVFNELDGWVRMRLRSILRKRSKRSGRSSGIDHRRYPNAWFAQQGLYSLTEAHAAECQSS